MRFQRGVRFPYYRRPRGPGRGDPPYRMSRAAYQARLRNLARWVRPRTYEETRRIELEIALGTHRREGYRVMGRRLGCSHVYCRKVARRYRAGQIPMLPRDEQGLVALRDSLGLAPPHSLAEAEEPTRDSHGRPLSLHQAPPEPARHLYELDGGESRWMTAAEYEAHCIAENWRITREEQRKHSSYGDTKLCTMQEWQERRRRHRGGGFRW